MKFYPFFVIATFLFCRCFSRSRKNPDKLALALDTYLHIFSHDLQDVFSIDFKLTIDVLEWTSHPQFLLLGLSNGQAQLVHVPTQTPLPAVQINVENEGFNDLQNFCFLPKESNSLIFLHVGDLQQLDQALQVKDFTALKAFQQDIKVESRHVSHPCKSINQNILSVESVISLLENNEFKHDLALDVDVVKILVPHGNQLIAFVLDKRGHIHVVCTVTMITLFKFSQVEVIDMVLIEDSSSLPQIMMVVVDKNEYFLQIRQYPDLEKSKLYSLKVSPYCRLLDTCLDQENPLFIEGAFDNEMKTDENVDTNNRFEENMVYNGETMLRIRAICEGHPEARLSRLLNRKKFVEAEKFARLNKLDLEEVYRSQCVALMSSLSAWGVAKCDQKDENDILVELEETLQKIQDLQFVVKFCLNATFKDLENIRRLLKLARQSIQQNAMQGMNCVHFQFLIIHV